jgi:hypothetical protein
MALGERLPNGTIQPRQGIVMSYQHLKAFAEALTTQLERLEKAMGEISYAPINPDAMKRDKD